MSRRRIRFPWFALLLGLLIGAAGGLYYAWFFDPVNRVNIGPAQLNFADRQLYIRLISEGYQQDGDLERARLRLAALGARDLSGLVKAEADSSFLRAENPQVVCPLVELASDLGADPLASEMCGPEVAVVPAETPTITPTFEGIPTFTPTPGDATTTPTPFVPTPTATIFILPEAGFQLTERFILCEESRRTGLIQVFVYSELEAGIGGVAVLIEWAGGSERIYTGLKAQIDPGYADFRMSDNTLYTVSIEGLSEPVVGIDSGQCRMDNGQFSTPTYQLVFEPKPPPEPEDN